MRKQNSSFIIKAIVLLLSMIIMVFVATLAWFAPPDLPVHATGVSVKTSAGKTFDMAVGFQASANDYKYTFSKYDKNLNLRDIITYDNVHYDVLSDFSPIDITGDGVTLVRPSMANKNKDIDRNSNTFTLVTENKEYISFDLYFRANEPCKVALDERAFAKGIVETEPGDGSLITSTERKADEGNFSKDCVVGAVRVSFVNYNRFYEGEDKANLLNEAEFVWLPRPDIHLNSTDNYSTNPWTLSTGLTPDNTIVDYYGASDRFIGSPADTFTHHFYTYQYDESMQKYVGEDRNYDRSKTVTDPVGKVICDVNYNNGGFYYGKTRVNIWIEGCDAEARRAISGGQFQVNFDFAAS